MEFIRDVQISDTVTNPEATMKILISGISVNNVYCICVNKKSKNLLEIIHSTQLVNKKYYDVNDFIFIGLCKGKNDSKIFAGNIIMDYFNKYRLLDNFRNHYLSKIRRQ